MKEKFQYTHRKRSLLRYGVIIFLLLFFCNKQTILSTQAEMLPVSGAMPTISETGGSLAVMPTIPVLPISTAPTVSAINLQLAFSGISNTTTIPLHLARIATVFVYNQADDLANPAVQPIATVSSDIVFDTTVGSPTSTLFVNPAFALNNLPTGEYQFLIHVPGYAEKKIVTATNKTFAVAAGQITKLPKLTLFPGDIDENKIIDIADYNGLLRCYGISATTSLCENQQRADLNDDGKVDAIDYNIFLSSLNNYKKENNVFITMSPPQISPKKIMQSTPTDMIPSPKKEKMILATPTPLQKKSSKTNFLAKLIVNQVFVIVILLVFCIVFIIGIIRSKLFAKFTKKSDSLSQATIDEVYYVKLLQVDANNAGEWVTLVNGDKQIQGYYKGKTLPDGFARIKGVEKEADGKKYIAISEVLPAV